MDKPIVDIYIEQSVKGPRRQAGAYGFVLKTMTSKGPVDRTHFDTGDNFSSHELELVAIVDALRHLITPCTISIHSVHGWFETVIDGCWIEQWKERNWKSHRGPEVDNRSLYEEILSLTESGGHQIVKIDKDLADYAEWLKREVEKAAEQHKQYLSARNFAE